MSKDTELAAETTTEGRENLKLWKAVEKTPPDMTKEVKYGKRKYTTIDPQWQLRVATALWGPYGRDWGLRNVNYQIVEVTENDAEGRFTVTAIILKAEFFYPDSGKIVAFEILNDDRFRAGDDTLKKLITNTRSKALSWLGFSADVFLGKFDDTAYVKDLKAKFGDQDAFFNTIATAIRTAKDATALAKCKERLEEIIADGNLDDVAAAQELMELVTQRKRELKTST
jgi:hypothetical protein